MAHPHRLSSSPRLTRRHFLRLSGAAALAALTRFQHAALTRAALTDPLPPGAVAPESWGPVGWYDALIAYIDTDGVPPEPGFPQDFKPFRGQVFILREPWQRATYVYLAGHSGAEVVKGYRVMLPIGLDQPHWSETELNVSLGGGGGGAQLRYDPQLGELILWLNGFVIGAPEAPARRFGFLAAVHVDRTGDAGKSRILHQSLAASDDVQYYMRAGTQPSGDSRTRFLMIAHIRIRAPLPLPAPMPGRPPVPIPYPTVTRQSNRLIVTQWNHRAQAYTSFVWSDSAAPTLDAPTTVDWTHLPTGDDLVTLLPRALHLRLNATDIIIEANTSAAADLSFTAEVPTPNRIVATPLTLATLPATDGILMTQATPVTRLFLPHTTRATR